MKRPSKIPVAVLGAGLTGMSAAFHLGRAGVPNRIFERLPQPGGHVITVEDGGYRFDRTGHLLHLRDPAIRELVLGWLGGDVLEIERRSMIWSNGAYTRYPFQANTFGLPPAVAYECLHGFVAAHFSKEGKPRPENFEEFCLMHFGEGISRHFMIPYNARLWGVPPREITADWCSRFVPLPKLEDVLAGAVGLNDRELGYNARFLYPRRGIGALTEGMARALPDIELGRAPRAIDWRRKRLRFDDEDVAYDVLVSTAPLSTLIALLEDPPPEIREAGRRLRCTHLYYLDVALNGPVGQPFNWVYVPEAKYPFYRVGCYSSFSPAMAPPGKANLYVELADRAEPDLGAPAPGRRGPRRDEAHRARTRGPLRAPPQDRSRLRRLRPRLLPLARDAPPVPGSRGDRLGRQVRRLELLVDGGRDPLRQGRRRERKRPRRRRRVSDPRISIVIPVYNEQAILHAAVVDLRERLRPLGWDYEVILAENGSRDETVKIAEELAAKYPEVRFFSLGAPNYGGALRQGIELARGRYVLCDEIDLCDTDFHRRAVDLLEAGGTDMVIGSKLIQGATDDRPWARHAASQLYNGLLRATLGFRGTDTHGLKAFVREALLPIARDCVVEKDVFASEFVIRAYRAGLSIREIPVRVIEKRRPSINLVSRVPNVLKSLAKLTWAIRIKG